MKIFWPDDFLKGKRETAKCELARDEMARKAASLFRESEALEKEVIRGKEKLNNDREMARERLEQEKKKALAGIQRAREDSEKEADNLTRMLEDLSRQEETIRDKNERVKNIFHGVNHVVNTCFSVAGGLTASFLGLGHPRIQYGGRPRLNEEGYHVQLRPTITHVTTGDEEQMEDQ